MRVPVVVLARLDGTSLDPYRHSAGIAAAAAARLAPDELPVVLFSSRTRAELERIQQQLELAHPFVAENGGAAYFPLRYFGFDLPHARAVAGYQTVAYGKPYGEIVATLQRTAQRLGIPVVGFNDMSVEQVADECGLSLFQARLAKLREHDEPFRTIELDPAARRRLLKGLHAARLECIPGERYEHAGAAIDHGAVVDLVLSLYRRAFGSVVSVGIGDPLTDVPLLRRVDVSIDIRGAGDDELDEQAEIIRDVVEAVRAGARLPLQRPVGDAVRLRGGV